MNGSYFGRVLLLVIVLLAALAPHAASVPGVEAANPYCPRIDAYTPYRLPTSGWVAASGYAECSADFTGQNRIRVELQYQAWWGWGVVATSGWTYFSNKGGANLAVNACATHGRRNYRTASWVERNSSMGWFHVETRYSSAATLC